MCVRFNLILLPNHACNQFIRLLPKSYVICQLYGEFQMLVCLFSVTGPLCSNRFLNVVCGEVIAGTGKQFPEPHLGTVCRIVPVETIQGIDEGDTRLCEVPGCQ